MHFRFLLLLPFPALIAFQSVAQSGRINRKSTVVLIDTRIETQQWQLAGDPGVFIKVHYLPGKNDSVVVYRNGAVSGTFLSHNDKIVSPSFVLRDEFGRIQSIDSFRLSLGNYRNEYYGSFFTDLSVRWEYYSTGIPSKVCYKSRFGSDSLLMEWSPEGIIQRRKHMYTEYRYTTEGILSGQFTWGDSILYNNGVISKVVNDTMVLNQLVKQVKTYSGKGILQKESWYKDGKPVATWREYNAEGVLVKTIKYPALVKVPVSEEVVAAADEMVFAYATQEAEYVGGSVMFERYMTAELQSVFSTCDFPLQGRYAIHFEITEEGKPVYVSVEGENAASIVRSVKSVIEKMPRWSPGKRSGYPIREGLVLTIKVIAK